MSSTFSGAVAHVEVAVAHFVLPDVLPHLGRFGALTDQMGTALQWWGDRGITNIYTVAQVALFLRDRDTSPRTTQKYSIVDAFLYALSILQKCATCATCATATYWEAI